MPDDKLPQRTLKTTFWLASFFAMVFGLRGEVGITFGLAIGAAIGLISLWSLMFAVPRLVRPGNPFAKLSLGLVAMIKLPVYAIALNFAMSSRWIEPFSVFAGAALVPMVLVLKVLGQQMVQKAEPVPAGE